MEKLDLHGIRHADVQVLVIRFVEDHWDEEGEFHIITGHSWVMKDLACDILREYKLDNFYTASGMPYIRFTY